MKSVTKLLVLLLALCMALPLGAFASGEPSGEASGEASREPVVPGTYTDGKLTLVIEDDMTFHMDKTGQNMEGQEFVLTVTGTVTADGVFTLTGLYDGDINLAEVATEEQKAADIASVEAVYDAATASNEPSGEPAGPITVNEDGTFTLQKTGKNLEGAEFVLTVEGIIEKDGSITLTGLYDGDLNLIDMATPEQIAADIASVQAALAG